MKVEIHLRRIEEDGRIGPLLATESGELYAAMKLVTEHIDGWLEGVADGHREAKEEGQQPPPGRLSASFDLTVMEFEEGKEQQ